MAEDVSQQVEEALNSIVKLTNESGNLKKDIRKSIHESVSNLRNLMYILKNNLNEKTSENYKLQNEVKEAKKLLEAQKDTRVEEQLATSLDAGPERDITRSRNGSPPSGARKKQYAEALAGNNGTRYKLTVRAKDNQTTETVKKIIKSSIDPTQMQIGIRTFKGLQNGKVLIEADTENDIQALQNQIRDKCGDRLETNVQKRRNPRLIIYNVPEETTLENAADIICDQNPELALTKEDITTKFIFKNKRNVRNLVIELTTKTYRIMRQKKLKIGWVICHNEEYISVTKCHKCSKFNHHQSECRSEETCPLCTGKHKLIECKATRTEYRCINCTTYNKYNQDKTVKVNHSSLDRTCPSMQAMIEKYRQNTAY
jgi:hypothetical protein